MDPEIEVKTLLSSTSTDNYFPFFPKTNLTLRESDAVSVTGRPQKWQSNSQLDFEKWTGPLARMA